MEAAYYFRGSWEPTTENDVYIHWVQKRPFYKELCHQTKSLDEKNTRKYLQSQE